MNRRPDFDREILTLIGLSFALGAVSILAIAAIVALLAKLL